MEKADASGTRAKGPTGVTRFIASGLRVTGAVVALVAAVGVGRLVYVEVYGGAFWPGGVGEESVSPLAGASADDALTALPTAKPGAEPKAPDAAELVEIDKRMALLVGERKLLLLAAPKLDVPLTEVQKQLIRRTFAGGPWAKACATAMDPGEMFAFSSIQDDIIKAKGKRRDGKIKQEELDWLLAAYEEPTLKGDVCFLKGNFDGACEHYEKALETKPNDPGALINAGAAHAMAGKGDLDKHRAKALELCGRAMALARKDPALALRGQLAMANALASRPQVGTPVPDPYRVDVWSVARSDLWGLPDDKAAGAFGPGKPGEAYEAAILLCDKGAQALIWACLKEKLGDCWGAVPSAEARSKATACYEQSLEIFNRQNYPDAYWWIVTKINRMTQLQMLAQSRATGKPPSPDRLQGVCAGYEQVPMEHLGPVKAGLAWHWLGDAIMQTDFSGPMTEQARVKAIGQARKAYIEAIDKYTNSFDTGVVQALRAAVAQEGLGDAYALGLTLKVATPGAGDGLGRDAEFAAATYASALKTITMETYPESSLRIQQKMARVLAASPDGFAQNQRMAKAIKAFKSLGESLGKDKQPGAWLAAATAAVDMVLEGFEGKARSPEKGPNESSVNYRNKDRLANIQDACQIAREALALLSEQKNTVGYIDLGRKLSRLEALGDAYQVNVKRGEQLAQESGSQQKKGATGKRKK